MACGLDSSLLCLLHYALYREQYVVLYSSIERSLVDGKMQNVLQTDAQGMPMCIMHITTVLSVQVQLPIS